MRIVGRPAEAIDPVAITVSFESNRIFYESRPDIALEVLAGSEAEVELMAAAHPAGVVLVGAGEQGWNPGDIAFRADQPEARKAAQHTAKIIDIREVWTSACAITILV